MMNAKVVNAISSIANANKETQKQAVVSAVWAKFESQIENQIIERANRGRSDTSIEIADIYEALNRHETYYRICDHWFTYREACELISELLERDGYKVSAHNNYHTITIHW